MGSCMNIAPKHVINLKHYAISGGQNKLEEGIPLQITTAYQRKYHRGKELDTVDSNKVLSAPILSLHSNSLLARRKCLGISQAL